MEGELPPEERERLVAAIDAIAAKQRKRDRIQILGYALTLVILLGGMAGGFYAYGAMEDSPWKPLVLLAPLAVAGGILWGLGRLSRRK